MLNVSHRVPLAATKLAVRLYCGVLILVDPGPAGLAVKAPGLARGQRGFDSHRSHAR